MRLARPFVERRWWVAAGLTVLTGPLIGMFYLGRGRLAIIYGLGEVLAGVVVFAIAVSFNLVGPDLGLGGPIVFASVPVRVAAAIHAARLARSMFSTLTWPWYARWGALLTIFMMFAAAPSLAASMVRATWMDPNEMKSPAMAPVIGEGDRVFVNKRFYLSTQPAVGDIVLVRDGDGLSYIRRIVALRGTMFVVRGEGSADTTLTLPRSAIVGKVTTIFWSASSKSWQWEALR